MSESSNNHAAIYNRSFAIGVLLNGLFVAVEAGYGIVSGSLALIADAGHNLSDVLILLLAWGAIYLSRKPATERRTYGFRKVTIMASLASAVTLLVALGGITWEAIGRFIEPKAVDSMAIIMVASAGVVINTITALMFLPGNKHDLNIKGAFLHMAADAGVSLGVVLAGVIIMTTGWLRIDPIISLIIVSVVLVSTWSLLRDSINLAIDAVPKHIDTEGIKRYLGGLTNVIQIHDLHIWPLSTSEVALSAHVVLTEYPPENNFLANVQQYLRDNFDIGHATIQVEKQDDAVCILDRDRCR